MNKPGKYIVIEGSDGTGKSEQVVRLRQWLSEQGIESIEFHEPDGVPIASQLRDIIKNASLERDAWTNVLLFTAARRANWTQVAEPALAAGKWIVSARNWLSTIVYQGYGESVDLDRITNITLDSVGETYLQPDLTLVLALQNETERNRRIAERGELTNPDTFESRGQDFQDKVQRAYTTYAREHNIPIIDASPSIDEIATEIQRRLSTLIN